MPQQLQTLPTADAAQPLQVETADVVSRLRAALGSVVTSVVGGPLGKSRDAQKHFDVDVKLSWQLFRTLGEADPLEVVGHIPPRGPFDKLIRAARRRRVEAALVDDAARAYDAFERHVERHAGDRTSFSRMLRSADEADGPADELPHRHAAFEASRQIWGSEKDATLQVTLFHPRSGGGGGGGPGSRFEVVSLSAIRGFRRWRTTAPVLLFKHPFTGPPDPADPASPRPLDPATFAELGVPLIGRFCSDPRPALRTRRAANDLTVTELASDAVGRLNSIDVTQGLYFSGLPLVPVAGDRLGWRLARINTTPARSAVMDLVVHRPTFGRPTFESTRLSNTNTFPADLADLDADPDVTRLPPVDKVTFVGNLLAAGPTAGVENYPDMLRYVCEQRGWRPADMDVYRHRSQYPLLSTLDSVVFTIPASQSWPRPPADGADGDARD